MPGVWERNYQAKTGPRFPVPADIMLDPKRSGRLLFACKNEKVVLVKVLTQRHQESRAT
jgi:hypothetical protein